MTVKVLAQVQEDGSVKYLAYHAHIVYHGNPDDDDFDPNDNHVVEVTAELPHPAALATWRDPMPQELAMAASGGAPRPQKVIDVICPDPLCMSVSTYPSNGDPEARTLHGQYADHVGKGQPQVPMPEEHQAVLAKLAAGEPLADHEAPPPTAADRLRAHVHGVAADGAVLPPEARAAMVGPGAPEHHPVAPYVANAWALEAAGLPLPPDVANWDVLGQTGLLPPRAG